MNSEARAAPPSTRKCSITAFGEDGHSNRHKESFRRRVARQQALPLGPNHHFDIHHPTGQFPRLHPDALLKRKTPTGTIPQGYDGSAYGADAHQQPIKHLIIQAPDSADRASRASDEQVAMRRAPNIPQPIDQTGLSLATEYLQRPTASSQTFPGDWRDPSSDHARPLQSFSIRENGPNTHNPSLNHWISTVPSCAQQDSPPFGTIFQADSQYNPMRTGPIHEPAMQAIGQRIDRLTLHDFTPPTDHLGLPGFSDHAYDGTTVYGRRDSGYSHGRRAYLPNFVMSVGSESCIQHPPHQAHLFPAAEYADVADYQISKTHSQATHPGFHNSTDWISAGPSSPEEILRRAHDLYASMQRTLRRVNRQDKFIDVPGSHSQSPLLYPSSVCECHWPRVLSQQSVATPDDPLWLRQDRHTQHRSPTSEGYPTSLVPPAFQSTMNNSNREIETVRYLSSDGTASAYKHQAKSASFVPPVDSALGEPYRPGRYRAPSFGYLPLNTYTGISTEYSHSLDATVQATLSDLRRLISDEKHDWSEARLIGGCLAFAVSNYDEAALWFKGLMGSRPCHVALSNLALTSLARKAYQEAERYWQLSLDTCPSHFDAAEHLIGLLCSQRRHNDAIRAIDRVCAGVNAHARQVPGVTRASPLHSLHGNRLTRFLGLIHAKGNVQYGLHQHVGAAKTFTEAVLLAAGLRSGSLADLVQLVLARLSGQGSAFPQLSIEPLLLEPAQALNTVKLLFGHSGHLPGLHKIEDMNSRKTALSIISSCLLSLAKIFQDGMISATKSYESLNAVFGVKEILALYYLSLSLQPSPSTANNVGILLAGIHQTSSSPGKSNKGPPLAEKYYSFGLQLDPKHAHLYTNYGSLLKDRGQLHDAISMYERAVACDPTFDIALANLANAVKDQGKTDDAIVYYKRAVKANPGFIEALCGLANALNSVCSWTGRGGAFIHNGAYDRWHVNEHDTLVDVKLSDSGSGWVQRVVEAVDKQLRDGESWGAGSINSLLGTDLLPEYGWDHESIEIIHSWNSSIWEGANVVRLVERMIRQIMWRWYQDKHIKRKERSQSAYHRPRLPTTSTIPSSPTVLPFHTFTLPLTARQIRLISQRNGVRVSYGSLRSPWLPVTVFCPPPPPSPHLNVGYVSSDFNNHPLAHLMQSVFGMHNKKRVKAFCYATTVSDNSTHRRKIEEEAPVFYDASKWSAERLVKQITQDGIHILVNLNGYTRGARNDVFAARPAPIQMSFMGFAGSLGAEWCDYILADEIAIPARALRPYRNNVRVSDLLQDEHHMSSSTSWIYSENIIFTRDSFFCCDHAQSAASSERALSFSDELSRRARMRRELFPDLPPGAIIFSCANQLYKIEPTIFRTWLRILYRVPNAYIWLLRFPASGADNLLRVASLWACPAIASRILFTEVAPKHVHIARGCIADLFLDTPECNAHTTAADCLWSGTPLLTLPRYEWKMCSRMGAGILAGALPMGTREGREAWQDLVAGSEDEYEARAVEFGGELRYASDGIHAEGRLMDLRRMIWEGRWTCPLFDTRRWVRDVEVAYEEAWRRWVKGEGGDIWLRDLL